MSNLFFKQSNGGGKSSLRAMSSLEGFSRASAVRTAAFRKRRRFRLRAHGAGTSALCATISTPLELQVHGNAIATISQTLKVTFQAPATLGHMSGVAAHGESLSKETSGRLSLMSALRAEYPVFLESVPDLDYVRGVVLAIFYFDHAHGDPESSLVWSLAAISSLPALIRRIRACVEAMDPESSTAEELLSWVSGERPSLTSVFEKTPVTLIAQYKNRISEAGSRRLVSCLQAAYRALLADRWKTKHHRSRFSVHIRGYTSWFPLLKAGRVSDSERVSDFKENSSTRMNRSVLTTVGRQAQEVTALTSTVEKLSKELASVGRKAREASKKICDLTKSHRKAALEIRKLKKAQLKERQGSRELRSSVQKFVSQQSIKLSCIRTEFENSLEQTSAHSAELTSIRETVGRLAVDSALVQLSVSKSREAHLEGIGFVNKSVALLGQGLRDLRDTVVFRSPNWFVNLLNESIISLPVATVTAPKLTLLGHLSSLFVKLEALQPAPEKIAKLTESFRLLEFNVKEDASIRKAEIELLRLPQRVKELGLQLFPILSEVSRVIPSLFPIDPRLGSNRNGLLEHPVEWLLAFPRLLVDAFPQLSNFDTADLSNSGWLQLMVFECLGADLQSRFHLNTRVRGLPWDSYEPSSREAAVYLDPPYHPFLPGSFQCELIMFLVYHDRGYFHSHLEASEELYSSIRDRDPTQCLPTATVKMRLAMAIDDWAYPNSPFHANALQQVRRNSYLSRSSSDINISPSLLPESVQMAASKAGLLKNTGLNEKGNRSLDLWPGVINQSYVAKRIEREERVRAEQGARVREEQEERIKLAEAEQIRAEQGARVRAEQEERIKLAEECQ